MICMCNNSGLSHALNHSTKEEFPAGESSELLAYPRYAATSLTIYTIIATYLPPNIRGPSRTIQHILGSLSSTSPSCLHRSSSTEICQIKFVKDQKYQEVNTRNRTRAVTPVWSRTPLQQIQALPHALRMSLKRSTPKGDFQNSQPIHGMQRRS